jgi:hypothetical protein
MGDGPEVHHSQNIGKLSARSPIFRPAQDDPGRSARGGQVPRDRPTVELPTVCRDILVQGRLGDGAPAGDEVRSVVAPREKTCVIR